MRSKLFTVLSLMLALLALSVLGSTPSTAQNCNASYSNINFGTVDLTTGGAYPTSATYSVTCTGTPGQQLYICGSGAAVGGPFVMSGTLSFSLFRDAAGSTPWDMNGIVTIGPSGSGSAAQTVWGRLAGGQQGLPPGSYLASGQTASYTFGTTAACGTGRIATIPAQAEYPASCRISAGTMTFNAPGLLTASVDATSTLSATCSSTAPYVIQMDGGLSQATDPVQRKLVLNAQQVTYGLYRDVARSQPWGSTIGVNTISGTGTGSSQAISVYGRIPPQTTPPPGTYQDLITVTINY